MTKNPSFPRFGTEKERNIATEYFNEKLSRLCAAEGIKFISIFKHLIDENYKTKMEFIADDCHLSQKAWIFAIDEFKKFGIEISFSSAWCKNLLSSYVGMQNLLGQLGKQRVMHFQGLEQNKFFDKVFIYSTAENFSDTQQ